MKVNPPAPCRLRKVKVDISSLPITTGRRSIRNGGHISGVFQPTVERLVRKSYGEGVTLAEVIYEIREVEWEFIEQRSKVREVYRSKQRAILFSYIKEIWNLLRNNSGGLSPNVTDDRQQLADIREFRVGGLDVYGYLPSDEALLKHVPRLSAVAAHIPTKKLQPDWFLKHSCYDPTVVIERRKPPRLPLWHNMRWDMRVDQKPAWFVEAAWRVIFQTVCEFLNTSLVTCMRLREGLQRSFVWALRLDLDDRIPYLGMDTTDPEDMEVVWIRIAYIWWKGEEVASWYWEHIVPETVWRKLLELGQSFQRGKRAHWARFGIQLHELGTRALQV